MKQPQLCHQQLIGLLDRPIAFHRCFVTLTGSITAALMLSQAVYWQQRTKHDGGWWFKKQEEWTDETGLSRREQENARRSLRKLKLLYEERRGVPAQLWYRLDEIRLMEMLAKPAAVVRSEAASDCTKPPIQIAPNRQSGLAVSANLVSTNPPILLGGFVQSFKGTETTTEITTETTTTTPNPSSSNGRSAEPEPARGGGGAQDPDLEPQDSNHGITAQEKPTEEKTVSQEETPSAPITDRHSNTATEDQQTVFQEERINGQLPELIYPTPLTTTEQQDIAVQLQPIPVEIAQQMLDVIESRIHSGQIRTNPAAVLRGILRKYQADPDAFDPSSGFQIADARRRRLESAARLEAAKQESIRKHQEMPPRRLSEIGRASLASMLNTLRGG